MRKVSVVNPVQQLPVGLAHSTSFDVSRKITYPYEFKDFFSNLRRSWLIKSIPPINRSGSGQTKFLDKLQPTTPSKSRRCSFVEIEGCSFAFLFRFFFFLHSHLLLLPPLSTTAETFLTLNFRQTRVAGRLPSYALVHCHHCLRCPSIFNQRSETGQTATSTVAVSATTYSRCRATTTSFLAQRHWRPPAKGETNAETTKTPTKTRPPPLANSRSFFSWFGLKRAWESNSANPLSRLIA